MAKKTQVKKTQSFLSQIKWGESYTSLFLGAIVVVVSLILIFSFIKARNSMNQLATSTSTSNLEQNVTQSSYTVKKGDDLWNISTRLYGSGYNWVDLAKANNLKNPSVLYVGTNLTVPNVKPKIVENVQKVENTNDTQTIQGNSYTVVKGDYLWNVAVRAYGDGYKWVEIARTNKLVNPNVIHSGNVLMLPR